MVFQDIYTSLGSSTDVSPYAYTIRVTLTNRGNTPFTFDTLGGAFLPENGRPLSNRTHPYDETKQGSSEAYRGSELKAATIAPGKSDDFRFTTDGYTFKLLRDAGDAPLRFGFTVAYKGKIVFGPLVADLPALDKLPLSPGEEKGMALQFAPPVPGKVYDKTQPRS